MHLHPADLGPVSVVAEIRDGSVFLQLTGSTEAGREALRDSLGELRQELSDAGFRNTSLDLRQGGQPGDQPGGGAAHRPSAGTRSGTGGQTPAATRTATETEPARASTPAGGRRLDLRV